MLAVRPPKPPGWKRRTGSTSWRRLLAAEQAKTARLLRQIRNRELADTGLYDEYGQPYK
jgi:hypothetical protein